MIIKFKKKLLEKQQEVLSTLSEGTVRFLIQKDLTSKCVKNETIINYYFEYFMKSYLKILKYLKYDFHTMSIYDIDDPESDYKDDIDFEIKTISDKYKELTKEFIKLKYNPIKIKHTLNKWRVINIIISNYEKILNLFEKVCGQTNYKDINITEQRQKLKEATILEENFDLFIKMVKNDQDRINRGSNKDDI